MKGKKSSVCKPETTIHADALHAARKTEPERNRLKPRSLLTIFGSTAYLLTSLFIVWLTLDWKVRKARKAFERQLIAQGMAKNDAERLGARYAALKDQVMQALKQQIFQPD